MIDAKWVTPDFEEALQTSCQWWLDENPSHPMLSNSQKLKWLEFCEKIIRAQKNKELIQILRENLARHPIKEQSFLTGYYEPLLKGDWEFSPEYSTPLYRRPAQDKKYSRKSIDKGALSGKGLELLYVNDPVDAFFLEIQGSGRIEMKDGSVMRVGYDGQNGYPYASLGKIFLDHSLLKKEDISLQTLKAWLKQNQNNARTLMQLNESYVFFKRLDLPSHQGPLGTQGLPLTPYHSLACDAAFWPFGMILSYVYDGQTFLSLTQDTGGAIKGYSRFDLFCGDGEESERIAGALAQSVPTSHWIPW